jgi:proline iminopeptidase
MKEDARQGYIPVKGGKIWYRISGVDKPGIPLIVLHGGPGAPHYYLEPLNALAADRPVVLYDQLGCGNSGRPIDNSLWTIDHFTEEIDIVRKELGLNKLHILGQSWGTMLAVDYMLTKKPEGVMSLILSSPCLSVSRWHNDCRRLISGMDQKEQKIILDCEAAGNYDSADYKEAMTAFYRKHLCRLWPWPESMTKTFENMGMDVYGYMWGPSEFTITGTLKNYERLERLKEIKIPALFTCGRFDEATPESTGEYHENLPGSELVIFENASHMHHIEKTQLYLKTISSFIGRLEG